MSLVTLKPERCVLKQLKKIHDSWKISLITLKRKKICNKAVVVKRGPWQLRHVHDWIVTQQQIDVWYDDDYYCNNDNEMIKWYKGYQKRKAQKAKKKKRRALTYCLASRSCDRLVYARRRKG